MTDIVERLRVPVMLHSNPEQTNAERREAAAEIERLRAASHQAPMILKHRHWWRRTSELQRVFACPEDVKPTLCFFVEQCRCGAVRTIELKPGEAPVIRMSVSK